MKKLPFLLMAAIVMVPIDLRLVAIGAPAPVSDGAKSRSSDAAGLTMFGNDGVALVSPLKHTDVQSEISGFISRTTVEQTFHNPAKGVVEALYTFPLPADAAVDEMTMIVGKRRIVGLIKRKEEARKIYEAAKSAGKTAALLDQERPNIFTQSVANILPGQDITVRISYVNLLKYEDGRYEWTFPTVVGPRYTATGGYTDSGQRGDASTPVAPNSEIESVQNDADKITPPIAGPGQSAGHDFSMQINLDAGVPLGEVNSVLNPIAVQRLSPTKARITLKDGAAIPNKDFVLRYRTSAATVQTGLLTHSDGRGGFFTLFFQPPPAPKPSQIAPRELIFAIDQTGSQEGWPIEKAKETMRVAMKALRPHDTFNLLGFDTEVHPCFRKSVPATASNIRKANKFLDAVDAGGGTDILKSVDYILRQPYDPKRLRIVCYMTDGYVGNDMQTIDYIRKHRGTTRIFPFGIGDSVNRFFIENMAREGRGFAQVVTLQEKGDEAGQKFIDRIARPVLLDPKVKFNGLPITEVFPSPLPDLFADGPLMLSGRFTEPAKGKITVSGIASGKAWRQDVPVDFSDNEGNGALPSLWARAKIENYQASDWLGAQDGNPNPDIKEKIVNTALAYKLMSQYTSFVAVEEKIVNPGGAQQTLDTPVEMPEGVSQDGIFGTQSEQAKRSQAAAKYALRIKNGEDTEEFAARPGDPLIRIFAPEGAKRVVAIFPGGDLKNLVWNSKSKAYEAHFDIPMTAGEGDYRVSVIVVSQTGRRQSFALKYRVDTTAPQGAGKLSHEGDTVKLELEAGQGVDRVSAFMPWGTRVELKRSGPLFSTEATVPAKWSAAKPQVHFVLTDTAHNRTSVFIDWN